MGTLVKLEGNEGLKIGTVAASNPGGGALVRIAGDSEPYPTSPKPQQPYPVSHNPLLDVLPAPSAAANRNVRNGFTFARTPRAVADVQSDIAASDAELERLREEQNALRAQSGAAMGNITNRKTGVQQMMQSGAEYGALKTQEQDVSERLSAAQAARDKLDSELGDSEYYYKYTVLQNDPDFLRKSMYRSTRNGGPQYNKFGQLTSPGYGDLLYDVVNGSEEAQKVERELYGGIGMTHSGWKDLPDIVVRTFNYLYALGDEQGDKEHSAAYDYLNQTASKGYTGLEAAVLGGLQGSGIASAAAGIGALVGLGSEDVKSRNRQWYGSFLQDAARAKEEHPVASSVGSIGGNLALLAATGGAAGAGAKAVGMGAGALTTQMAVGALSFAGANAVQNAGAVSTGYMSGGDYLKGIAVSGAQGLAGNLAGGLIGSGMADLLRSKGLMTPFMEFVRQTAGSMTNATVNQAVGYLAADEKPSGEEIAEGLVTAFAFSLISGAIGSYKTTQAQKSNMETAYKAIEEGYQELMRGTGNMTPEELAQRAQTIIRQTQSLRRSLNSYYIAGQQASVNELNGALDLIEQTMQNFLGGQGTSAGSAAASMLPVPSGSAAVPATAYGVNRGLSGVLPVPAETQKLTQEIANAVSQGLEAQNSEKVASGTVAAGKNIPKENTGVAAAQSADIGSFPARTAQDAGAEAVDAAAVSEYNNSIRNGGVKNGAEEIYLRDGGERTDGTDTGGEFRAVAEGAGRDQSREIAGRPADDGAASLSYGEKVSPASLGISGGSETAGVRLVTGGDTEATRAAKRLGEERGLDVVLFGGGNLSIQQNGRTVSAQAFISGNRVYVRADHPDYTADQLMRHEAGHDMIAKGELDPATVRQRIAESFGEAKLDQLAELYSAAYRSSDLTPSEVWEEVVCDSLGDMNIFHDIPVMEEHAQELLNETKKAAGADIETMRVRGPPTAAAEDKASRYFNYESVSRQAWSQIQSRRMAKYGGHFDEMPRIDTLHAHDKLYLIENFDESSFSVLKVVDPSEDQNLANYFTEETKNGNIRDAATSRKGARELRSRGGERARNRPYDGYTGAAKENAGLYAQRGGTEESVQSSGEGFGDRSEYRTDSQGRKLSEAQQAYFRDSAVRDEDGRLLPVYHATYADEFTVFDREKLGENTDGNATDESWAATSHIGFWFSSKNLSRKSGLGSRAETVYLNITNPFYADSLESLAAQMEQYEGGPAERGEAFADWLRSDGYDGVVVQDEEFGGTSYVALESEQAKRITNQNPTGDPDIRFSQDLAELEALRKENERLKSRVEHWKGQLRQTTPETRSVRQGDIDRLARQLVRNYGGTLKASDISGRLKALGDLIVRGGDEFTWARAHEKALDIAEDLVENAVVVNDDMYREYSQLRNYLKTTRIVYGEELHSDIADYPAFRKQARKRINLISVGRTNVDVVYEELSEMYPAFFDSTAETHPTDQLLHIMDVLDGLQPVYENPFSYDMAAAEEYAAGEILDALMGEDIRQAPPTYADRQARKLEETKHQGYQQVQRVKEQAAERLERQRERDRERLDAAIARERQRRDERVQQLKDHYAEVRKNQAARRADSAARTKLLNIARRLQNKKLPAATREQLDRYIGDLDTISKGLTGKTVKKLSELKEWYEAQKENDPDFISDPYIEKKLAHLEKKHISDMTADEVADLTDILKNIENELKNERKLIDEKEKRDIYHLGQETIQNIYNTKGQTNALDKYIVTETLSPLRQLRRMTGYVDDDPLYVLTQKLSDGQRNMLDYQMKAERPFASFAKDKAFNTSFAGSKAERVLISGVRDGKMVEVAITPAMRVSLYLHSLNDQNLLHIRDGGITVPDEKLYRKGKFADAYARGTTIRLTPSQVREITSKMTDKERLFAETAHRYFNETSRKAINETSEQLKGYSIAQVDNYFPINTDSSFTKSEFEDLKMDGTIEGMGFLKPRVRSTNPILLRDVNDVLQQSIRMHGKYVGLAIPVRNFGKVWNMSTVRFLEDGSVNTSETSVQQAVKQRWGSAGYGYVEKMMTDLQNGVKPKKGWVKLLNKGRSNYAGAVLTLNFSVALKQTASYPTAIAVLGWRPVLKAMLNLGKVDLEKIEEYTPLQWYRSQGYSTKELGDLKESGWKLPPFLNWIQALDLLTTRKLWKACELYVKQHNPVMQVGSDVYYRTVADVYNRVIEETQPVYTTMQRPQLLRSDDPLLSNLAMFKTQLFQNFNIIYDAAGNYLAKTDRAKHSSGEEKAAAEEAAKEAGRNLGRAVSSQFVQLLVISGMTAVMAFLRGKDKRYRDDDGNLTLQSFMSAFGKDMLGGVFSSFVGGSEVWAVLDKFVFGDTYYGIEATTVTAISDAATGFTELGDLIGESAESIAKGEKVDLNAARLKIDGMIDKISKLFGVPYENVLNLGKIIILHSVRGALGKYRGEYAYLLLTTDPHKYSSDYYDILFRAMQENKEDYESMYADMVERDLFSTDSRTTEEAIASAMESRMKKAQNVQKADELERRYLTPAQEQDWDEAYSEIAKSRVWKSANEEQRSNMEKDLYDLVTGNSHGEKLQEKIDGGSAYGISETDYLLYLLALEVKDKPTENGKYGSYTNDEVAEAIRMLDGLSNDAKGYLWTSQGKNEKSNPWG